MQAPTPQDPADDQNWYDDQAIAGSDQLVRFITANSLAPSEGPNFVLVVSPKAYEGRPGVSVELERLYASEETVRSRTTIPFVGAQGISAEAVRNTPSSYKKPGAPNAGRLGVCYTPAQIDRDTNQPAPNPYHCDIFPKTTKKALVLQDLFDHSVELVPVDQAEALKQWIAAGNIWPPEA